MRMFVLSYESEDVGQLRQRDKGSLFCGAFCVNMQLQQ